MPIHPSPRRMSSQMLELVSFHVVRSLWPSNRNAVPLPALILSQGPTKKVILVQEHYFKFSLNSIISRFLIKVWRLYSFMTLEFLMDTQYSHVIMRDCGSFDMCVRSALIVQHNEFCNRWRETLGRIKRGGWRLCRDSCVNATGLLARKAWLMETQFV